MDVMLHRLCVIMNRERAIHSFRVGNGVTSEGEKPLVIDGNVWWRCAHYSVIAFCG